jgi:hypothetical protein
MRYKLGALDRDMEHLWTLHKVILPNLHDFQKLHFEHCQLITVLIPSGTEAHMPGISSDTDHILGRRDIEERIVGQI